MLQVDGIKTLLFIEEKKMVGIKYFIFLKFLTCRLQGGLLSGTEILTSKTLLEENDFDVIVLSVYGASLGEDFEISKSGFAIGRG